MLPMRQRTYKYLVRFGFIRFCVLEARKKQRREATEARWNLQYSAFAAIGQIANTWAIIEHIVDRIIDWYHPIAGRATIQEPVPSNFNDKLKYINRMTRDKGFTPQTVTGLNALRYEGKRLHKLRSLILHGVYHRNYSDPIGWYLQVRDYDKGAASMTTCRISQSELMEASKQLSNFLHALSPWALELIKCR